MAGNSQQESKVNRRSILEGLGIGAFGAATFGVMSATARTNEKAIPYVKQGDEVIKWKKVPAEWYNHIRREKRIKEEFSKRYRTKSGVTRVESVRSPKKYGGKHGLQIRVRIEPDELQTEIPDSIDGIPITRKTETPTGLGSC